MKSFLKTGSKSSDPVNVDQYNLELDQAMERIIKGQFTTLEELEREMQSW